MSFLQSGRKFTEKVTGRDFLFHVDNIVFQVDTDGDVQRTSYSFFL